MYSTDQIEKTLNELLANTAEIQHEDNPMIFTELSHQQQRLLDRLFSEWDQLDEQEKTHAFISKIESKTRKLSQKNKACLKKIQEAPRKTLKSTPRFLQLNLHF